jgi:predicted RNA-binding protein with PIN domain
MKQVKATYETLQQATTLSAMLNDLIIVHDIKVTYTTDANMLYTVVFDAQYVHSVTCKLRTKDYDLIKTELYDAIIECLNGKGE